MRGRNTAGVRVRPPAGPRAGTDAATRDPGDDRNPGPPVILGGMDTNTPAAADDPRWLLDERPPRWRNVVRLMPVVVLTVVAYAFAVGPMPSALTTAAGTVIIGAGVMAALIKVSDGARWAGLVFTVAVMLGTLLSLVFRTAATGTISVFSVATAVLVMAAGAVWITQAFHAQVTGWFNARRDG